MAGFIAATEETVRRVYEQQPGFRGFWLLTDPAANTAMSISLWDSEADILAHEASDIYHQRMAEVAPLGDGHPVSGHYEVAIQASPRRGIE
jgi:heme-degrading monooxygenase HmoA/predicted Zn-ribbon and HTH transcriptional regulator